MNDSKQTPVSLFFSCATETTETNHTGSWRFVRPVAAEKTAPCSAACPAGEDIARIETLVSGGRIPEAAEAVLMENPFPSVCGRVCFHPCEEACNRGSLDGAVAVHLLERFVGDAAPERIEADAPSGKRVAIVGAGPAGLSAAYFLARLGHGCEIFESEPAPGGVLRWGIPRYRLPEAVLEREIARIEALGVKIHCNRRLDAAAMQKAAESFDALFVGCGHGRSLSLGVKGEEHALDGLKLLADLRRGREPALGKRVAVIGGGNTAVDVARSLLRLGVQPVMIYRRRRSDMPAYSHEIEMALEEGLELRTLLSPVRLDSDSGGLKATFSPMKVAGVSDTGRARVAPVKDSLETILFDAVVAAVGAESDPAVLAEGDALPYCRMVPGPPPRIWGGDLTNSHRRVPDAVASGKAAAMALDTFFRHGADAVPAALERSRVGQGPALSFEIYKGGSRRERSSQTVLFEDINTAWILPAPRVSAPVVPAPKRRMDFSEVVGDLDPAAAAEEARRCFSCGLCNDCDICRLLCPDMAVVGTGRQRRFLLDYCKGCGICAAECPRSVLDLAEEA